ncbi:MAG: UDP-N-acetylmuramate--L-alanine ligase [Chlamydiae bacterium]|nr:UDP-N-acetylmuramate--L-alanine ligase [Chlamydiota bacterium]
MTQEQFHFIGIGGIGMSALARYLLQKKCNVKGTDLKESYIIQGLENEGANIKIGHNEEFIQKNDIVVYSSAVMKNNPEFKRALELNNKIIHRSDLLAELMRGYDSLLITGTHGKTTTSSLVAHVLMEALLDPSFIIGGIVNNYHTNGRFGQGKYFVAEADESDGSFLNANPFGAIVTNLEIEHLDYWKSFENLKEGFSTFFSKVSSKSHFFWCFDDPVLRSLSPKGISYGFAKEADLRAENVKDKGFSSVYDIFYKNEKYLDVEINLSGAHNVSNSLAVFGLALELQIKPEIIKKAFKNFLGVKRRLEKIKEHASITFLDDYAHHPTEIKATLKALRGIAKEKRIVAIFQPHRYSRLQTLMDQFADSFNEVDELIVTDVYSAGEVPIHGVDQHVLLSLLKRRKIKCDYIPEKELEKHLQKNLKFFDMVITLGAGSISQTGRKIAENFSKKEKKLNVALIFGGKSPEHEISILSAKNFYNNLNTALYNVELFGITKEGNWLIGKEAFSLLEKKQKGEKLEAKILKQLLKADVCLPILHGPFGEDGMIQGFLDTLDIPYIGCDYYSCAISMNKAWSKYAAVCNNVLTAPYVNFSDVAWREDRDSILLNIENKLKFPLFIKPVHLGSSIGISYCEDKSFLSLAIDEALKFDTELVIEEKIIGREIQFAVFGNDYVEVLAPGEILGEGIFHDYNRKYLVGKPMSKPKVDLTLEKLQEGKFLAKKMYLSLGCTGFTRLDFFIDKEGIIYFNEANPIPGLTATSLYPNMIALEDISLTSFIDHTIMLALHRKRKMKKLEFSYI